MDIDSLPAPDLRQRLHYVAKYAKWESLIEIAAQARAPNAKCLLNPKIGFGGEHMIREICFEDGVSWIAKLPIGPISIDESGTCSFDANSWGDQQAREMQIEIDTMNFLASQSSIPVPRVYAADTSCQNPVQLPYMLMDAIRGNSVRDLGDSVPEPFLNKYLVALAQIQVQSNWRESDLGLGRTLQPYLLPMWCNLQRQRRNIYRVRYSNSRRTIPDCRGLLQGVVNVERTRPSTNNQTEPRFSQTDCGCR